MSNAAHQYLLFQQPTWTSLDLMLGVFLFWRWWLDGCCSSLLLCCQTGCVSGFDFNHLSENQSQKRNIDHIIKWVAVKVGHRSCYDGCHSLLKLWILGWTSCYGYCLLFSCSAVNTEPESLVVMFMCEFQSGSADKHHDGGWLFLPLAKSIGVTGT